MKKNTLNIGKLMRETTHLRISQGAIEETKTYIQDWITGYLIPNAERYAIRNKRKTIMEEDIIHAKDLK